MTKKYKKQKGAALVEYSVGVAFIVIALLLPIPPENKNAVELLVEAFQENYSGYSYGMSMPI